ncbi:MAG TPA: methionyl-tRNA formyltransferase, partial [Candidatus Wallbacteria bacterium]|nr:methionyl-tRNA formyltransferase [Candidatus Wallbacteria bacterium]
MNILFMGTPDFSVPSLKALAGMPGHKVVGVVTTCDQPVGRSLKMTPPPVKVCALELGIPVFQPEKLNTDENLELFKSLGVDIIAIVAYGKIIGSKLLAAYPQKIINVHPSLLPKYRGVAPYQWALINGEKKTGVSIMYIAKELDAGDIVLRRELAIKDSDNASTLHDSLAVMGAEMLAETVALIDDGKAVSVPQNHAEATYY